MFGSISNWINTNVSQVQQSVQQQVQNVQSAMPPVNIPDFFSKNKNANGDGPTEQDSENKTNQLTDPNEVSVGFDDTVTPKPENHSENNQKINETIEKSVDSKVNDNGFVDSESENQKSKKAGLINMQIDVDAQKALGTAKEFGNNIGNMLFSFGKNASTNVMKTATQLKDALEKTPIIGDFTKENEKFINEKKNQQKREEAAVPPWVGYHNEEKLKQEIMELSTDSRNFMRSPPPGVDFPFDYNAIYPVALATLEEDQNLKDMRFKLVPGKIKEEEFWRNYFYRVTLIRESNQLDALNSETSHLYENSRKSEAESDASSKHSIQSTSSQHDQLDNLSSTHNAATAGSVVNNEFVSDSYHDQEGILSAEELNKDLEQLNLNSNNSKKEIDEIDWEKELPEDMDNISAEELEKEINQMIGRN